MASGDDGQLGCWPVVMVASGDGFRWLCEMLVIMAIGDSDNG